MLSPTEQIKERLNITDVVGSYLKLEKAGINYKAKCPFHNEKTASFFVSPARQSFYCFGCGEKGDIFTFVEKFEGLDFKSALKKQVLYKIAEEACVFFENKLKDNQEAKKYLGKRGLSAEAMQKWRVGFAEDEWRKLHDALLAKNFSKNEMLDAGLSKEKDGKYYDTFRARIMFPICDASGRVIAFSGRSFPDKESAPKYLNSPETSIFHKSDVLYGWHLAKSAIRKLDYTVLVEGQMDLLLSHQAGVINSVASSGTALTENHLQKIKRLSNRVIIAYDSDEAGEKASRRAAELALTLGLEVKITSLPEGEDPASIILENKEVWKQYLRDSQHLIDFALAKISRDKKGTALMKEVERSILPYFAFIKSEIEKSHFIGKIASKIGVSEEAVIKEVAKFQNTEKNQLINPEIHEAQNPERMMAGILFLTGKDEIKKRWEEIIGQETLAEILERYDGDKEALIFEAEEFGDVSDELLTRIELQILRNQLRQNTNALDHTKGKEEEILKKEIEIISKRVNELSKITSK